MTESKFKVGDRVRLTGREWIEYAESDPTRGQVFEITRVDDTYSWFRHAGMDWFIDADDYSAELVAEAEQLGVNADEFAFSVEALGDPISPNHYQFPGGVEVRQISAHLTSFGGQAVQYIARSTRLDGKNKGDQIENLKKAQRMIDWEIERLEAAE